jgi:hypothetical protein
MAATPWPIVTAEEELNLATLGPPNPEVQPDPDTWIAGLGSLPLLAQPGERWLYNTGDFFKGRSWGYGQAVHDSGAFGWDGGFGSSWLVDPANDLTAIVLTQRMFETPEPPRVHRDIQAAAYAGLV